MKTVLFIDGPLRGELRAMPDELSILRAYQRKPGTGESGSPVDAPEFEPVDYVFTRIPFLGRDILIGEVNAGAPPAAEVLAELLLKPDALAAWGNG